MTKALKNYRCDATSFYFAPNFFSLTYLYTFFLEKAAIILIIQQIFLFFDIDLNAS